MKILRYTHTHNVVVTIAEHSGETEKGGKKERNKLAAYDLVTKKQQLKKKKHDNNAQPGMQWSNNWKINLTPWAEFASILSSGNKKPLPIKRSAEKLSAVSAAFHTK